jgi:hypothetical protein
MQQIVLIIGNKKSETMRSHILPIDESMIWFFEKITIVSLFCFVGIGISTDWNSTGITVAGVTNSPGIGPNQLQRPYCVRLGSSNTLYITDQGNQRVQKWLTNASTGITVAGSANGVIGNTSNYFDYPADLVVDSSGNLYVADAVNNRVMYWPNGASSGTLVAGTGMKSY